MNSRNSCFRSEGSVERTVHGPLGTFAERQMILTSAIFNIPLATIDRSTPRENPSDSSPRPDVQTTQASYCRFKTAITPCSCPPEKPVCVKNFPSVRSMPLALNVALGIRYQDAEFGSVKASEWPFMSSMDFMPESFRTTIAAI